MSSQENISLVKNRTVLSGMAVAIVAAYVSAQLISNIGSLKIGVVLRLSVDMGTFLYPITFTLRDVVHKKLGKRIARIVIITAGVINLFMALYLKLISLAPGDASWGLNTEFTAVLSPVWRIVAASIIAQVVSELLDTEIYHWFVTKITHRFQWLRVLVSNSISVPIDSLIFSLGAFALTLSWSTVLNIFIFNMIIKYAVTVCSLPMIYIVRDSQANTTDE